MVFGVSEAQRFGFVWFGLVDLVGCVWFGYLLLEKGMVEYSSIAAQLLE